MQIYERYSAIRASCRYGSQILNIVDAALGFGKLTALKLINIETIRLRQWKGRVP